MKSLKLSVLISLIFFSILWFQSIADHETVSGDTSIVFATLGRSNYAFDIFTIPISNPRKSNELRITDGESVNFNGQFPSAPLSSAISFFPNQTQSQPPTHIIYTTERNGKSSIYYDAVYYETLGLDSTGRRSAIEEDEDRVLRFQLPLIVNPNGKVSMKDKASLVGDSVVYVSTHEDPGMARTSWTAVYRTELASGLTRRLTPNGSADLSPAVSPSGAWTAVASYGEKGWDGEVQELGTDIYVFSTRDGSGRVKVVNHGGWPCWADETTLYFHRRSDDGWWSIYRAILPENGSRDTKSVTIQRVTPAGLHAFTPATSPANRNFMALATRRPDSDYRHIELFDIISGKFTDLTRSISPKSHNFNPFISPDFTRVGYHSCRGRQANGLLLENLQSPVPGISLFRIDGSYPSFSPDGDRIAYVKFPGVYVVNRDGSNRVQVLSRTAFSTAWDPVQKGIIYTAVGPTFASESTRVDIIAVNINDNPIGYKTLTTGGENNAFPSPSPDGKWLVFRSGRSRYKNLYIMDAIEGEKGGIFQLSDGPWTDTMCNWSPDGDRIAFASDRSNPGQGSFEIFTIHPNRTGLKKLVQSGLNGRTNHPWFSPDGKHIVFTSDYAGVSAEPISNPHHYQPYGDIFTIKIDGSDITRLTHNSYEDGTPTWGPAYIRPADVERSSGSHCSFEDCHWLKETPNHGHDGAPLATYSKPQCAATI